MFIFVAGALFRNTVRRQLAVLEFQGLKFSETRGFLDSQFVVDGPAELVNSVRDWVRENEIKTHVVVLPRKEARKLNKRAVAAGFNTYRKRHGREFTLVISGRKHSLEKWVATL